jgi:hypothetical protein
MQLDYLLKSGKHAEGYKKIRNKYKDITNITFLERKEQIFGLKSYFPTLYNIPNIKLFIKNTRLFNEKCDNFKGLLENLLKTTKCEYVMFNTDDGFFFDDVDISPNILNLIKLNPYQTSYRLYVGENLDGFPDYLNKVDNDYYVWNYYEHTKITHWTYPFAVDGTVYHTKSIFRILRKVFYHNPITLESCAIGYVIKNKFLGIGLGPITSKIHGTLLNRVSTNSLNPTIKISSDFLNEKFLENYELELELPKKINQVNIVPYRVFIVKSGIKKLIYSLDENGRIAQNSFGIGGAKSK